ADAELAAADREKGPLGEAAERARHRVGAVVLDDREAAAWSRRQTRAKRGVERAAAEVDRPGDAELVVATPGRRAVRLDDKRGPRRGRRSASGGSWGSARRRWSPRC